MNRHPVYHRWRLQEDGHYTCQWCVREEWKP